MDVEGVARDIRGVAHGDAFDAGARAFFDLALSRYPGSGDAQMFPAGRDTEVISRHVVAVTGGGDGDGGEFGTQIAGSNTGTGVSRPGQSG